jgi:hypothetical protein
MLARMFGGNFELVQDVSARNEIIKNLIVRYHSHTNHCNALII